MKRKGWAKLDNASKIFLSTMTSTDTKVFRLSAEVREEVDPLVLQEALDRTYGYFRLYHSIMRRGFFWYYLEDSDLKPRVEPDVQVPCAGLYRRDEKNLLFRVLYHGTRIHLEVFHALSDGTGALWFFDNLLYNYIDLRYPDALKGTESVMEGKGSQNQLLDDSFERHFGGSEEWWAFNPVQMTVGTVTKVGKAVGKAAVNIGGKAADVVTESVGLTKRKRRERILRVKGARTPDGRIRIVETEMAVDEVLKLAKEAGTSLTIYLTAIFIEATHRDAPRRRDDWTISVSIPVNLRQFFKSSTARNFFSTVQVSYTYGLKGEGGDTIGEIARTIDEEFKGQLTPENIRSKVQMLKSYEENIILRIMPRPLKDLVMRSANALNNRKLTLAISNMGRVSLQKDIDGYVDQIYAITAAARPQLLSVSHAGILTVAFMSPFTETEIQKNFVTMLTEKGVRIKVSANKVDNEEMGNIVGKE